MNKFLILLSGGTGSRFMHTTPKQYYETATGELVISRSIANFVDHDFRAIIVVCDSRYKKLIKTEFENTFDRKLELIFTNSGDQRQLSIDNGIEAIKSEFKIGSLDQVFIQEAVRPFVSKKLVTNLINADSSYMAVNPAIYPFVLFAYKEKDLSINKLISKTDIVELQVPKRYNLEYFIKNRKVLNKDPKKILDESEIFTLSGEEVHLIEGEESNVKITYPSHKSLLD